MKTSKWWVIGGMLVLAILVFGAVAWATDYYVATTGSNSSDGSLGSPWLTIQYAVDTVSTGDTINVEAGTYNEGLININQTGLTISSVAGPDTTIISSVNMLYSFKVTADNVTITGFTIQQDGHNSGIYLGGSGSSSTVTGCEVSNCIFKGIKAHGCWLLHCTDSLIDSNKFLEPGADCCTFVLLDDNSSRNVIRNNEISGGGLGGSISMQGGSNDNLIDNNTITNPDGGIFGSLCDNLTIINNTVSDSSWYSGIDLVNCNSPELDNNTVTGSAGSGIWLGEESGKGGCNNAVLTNNTCTSNGYHGINISFSDDSTVSNNTCTSNTYRGIYLKELDNCTVSGNQLLSNGEAGLKLLSVTNSTVEDNNVSENVKYGILVEMASSNNQIIGNDIVDNATGDQGVAGIRIDPKDSSEPIGTHIHSNNIVGNTKCGVSNTATEELDATNNWWGSASGPEHAGNTFNVGSQGNAVSDNVDYLPWYDTDKTGTSFAPVTTDETSAGEYSSIQAAVDAASAGHTITCAAGTYDEQVVITKSLTLQGTGDTTIIKPSQATASGFTLFERKATGTGLDSAPIVVAKTNGGSVNVKNLKIDGSLVSSVPGGATLFAGILYRDTNGVIDTVTIRDIGICQGNGMYLVGHDYSVAVEAKNSDVSNYFKNGITANYPNMTANIHDNTVTGGGPTADSCQNGIQIGYGATGTIKDNTVDGHYYTNPDWAATDILVTASNATVEGNTLTGGYEGIGVDGGYTEGSSWTLTIKNNTVDASDMNSSQYAFGIHVSTYKAGQVITATIEGNRLIGGPPEDWGIVIGESYFNYLGDVVFTIKDNNISGWDDGIYLGGSVGSGSTITGNTVQNNTGAACGIHLDTDANAENVTVHSNKIEGNTGTGVYGVYNGGTGRLDATNNWWGACGPSGEGPGTGDAVSTNVDFDPWYTDQGMTTQATMASNTYGNAGYNLVSVPLQPMCSGNGDSVFDEAGQLQFRLLRYNPSTLSYDIGGDLTVNPEYGFWLYLSAPKVIDMGGTDVTDGLTTGNYWETTANFADGWQQIGAPFTTQWMATMVSNDNGANWVSMDGAMTNLWLDSQIFAWNSTTQEYEFKSYTPGGGEWNSVTLKAWDGCWVKNESGGNLKFKFYYDSTVQRTSFSPKAMRSTPWRPMSELAPGADRPPAPPMFPQGMPVPSAAAITQNIDVMVAPNPVQQGRAVEFRVVGEMAMFVSSVSVQVYTIGGQLVFDESSMGQAMTWGLTTLSGEPVANGLYLYVAQMEFIGGQTAKFNKLLILK